MDETKIKWDNERDAILRGLSKFWMAYLWLEFYAIMAPLFEFFPKIFFFFLKKIFVLS